METIRAVQNIARAQEQLLDGARTPGGMALRRHSPTLNVVADKAIMILDANGLSPAQDAATQYRLATALDRQITGPVDSDQQLAVRDVLNDVYLQEAASRRLSLHHGHDPLGHLCASPDARNTDDAQAILSRNRIDCARLLRTTGIDDLQEIAAGRYDKIVNDVTRQKLAIVLRLTDYQMRTRTAEIPPAVAQRVPTRAFPQPSAGPQRVHPAAFGKKVGAER